MHIFIIFLFVHIHIPWTHDHSLRWRVHQPGEDDPVVSTTALLKDLPWFNSTTTMVIRLMISYMFHDILWVIIFYGWLILIVIILKLWWSNCKIHVLIRWYAILSRFGPIFPWRLRVSGLRWMLTKLRVGGKRRTICPNERSNDSGQTNVLSAGFLDEFGHCNGHCNSPTAFFWSYLGLSEDFWYPLIQWIIMIVLQKSSLGFPVSDAAIINLRDFLKLGVFRLV